MNGYRRISINSLTGLSVRNGNCGDDDGPRAVSYPTLTYKTPQYEDLQPYNGIVVEEDLLTYNLLLEHT